MNNENIINQLQKKVRSNFFSTAAEYLIQIPQF